MAPVHYSKMTQINADNVHHLEKEAFGVMQGIQKPLAK